MKEAALEFRCDFALANRLFPSQSMDASGIEQLRWPLLCTGSAQQFKDDVKSLIDVGDTGSLIIDGNQGIPGEAKPENVIAMWVAVNEYGVFQ
jgi:hypothetical protein